MIEWFLVMRGNMKGCICLDIDGTLTADPHFIPDQVVECLRFLYGKGWNFVFATGRTYSFAIKTLEKIDFPFLFAAQNGADILQMPEKKLLSQSYLSSDVVFQLERIGEGKEEDFLIYTGWEKGDFCYYRPKKFSQKILDHIEIIQSFSVEPWQALDEFHFKKNETFPLIKYLGTKEGMQELTPLIQKISGVEISFIKDPVSEGVYLNLITAPSASKGEVLRKVRSYFPKETLFIAAGDDLNDVSMLEEADIAIVMGSAPEKMLSLADIKAKSAKELGIIQALLQATQEEMK